MSTALVPAELPANAVFARGGDVLTSRVIIADVFAKRHSHVLRDVEVLISTRPNLGRLEWFRPTTYRDAKGEDRPAYDLTRDGLSLLVMGFNGAKALDFKLAFVQAFNRIEGELRARPAGDPLTVLNDTAAMRGLLLGYTEQVLALQADKAALAPKAEALDRIANADGSFCITNAANALQMRRKDLIAYLQQNGWICRRPGCEAPNKPGCYVLAPGAYEEYAAPGFVPANPLYIVSDGTAAATIEFV